MAFRPGIQVRDPHRGWLTCTCHRVIGNAGGSRRSSNTEATSSKNTAMKICEICIKYREKMGFFPFATGDFGSSEVEERDRLNICGHSNEIPCVH